MMLDCLAFHALHTLQLAVNEGLLAQRSVADAVAVGRKVVGHFKHSTLSYSRLEDIQLQLNQPIKRLQQDVKTRWNSTFCTLQSLTEQKRALGIFGSEHELPDSLGLNQWNLLEKPVTILTPFEELTRQVSSSDASASDVIPAITVLQRLLSKEADEEPGINTMKRTLLTAVQKRFADVEQIQLFSTATLLDPRYKDRFFSSSSTAENAKEKVMQELQKISGRDRPTGE
ncbi:zinc finger BED domain-containing protein 4-like isoform X1 [Colossoma macropomum]|uniref:zinc finger BED domain-containing protein 4-like isoform X1 n=1 Tax=Colossoma macropomum TaxID=42526 RepID=UPI00186459A3|nr:zinc finger BED domain-containing protein 4-like isoform X1 [Colossoma macropomum]